MASVPQYMYATQGDDVLVNLYIQSSADIDTDNNNIKLRQTTEYPWNGNVTMTVDPEKEGEFALRLRIPGWSQDAPVPTDLYSFTTSPSAGYEVKVNGKKADVMTGNGYATVKRQWKKGDKVELTLPMDVKRVRANDNVADDKGKLAIQRGYGDVLPRRTGSGPTASFSTSISPPMQSSPKNMSLKCSTAS